MTNKQRRAITLVLKVYLDYPENYVSDMWDNDFISAGLKVLFDENVISAEELSKEIGDFVGVYVSPHILNRAADGMFIDVMKGSKLNE